MSPVDLYVSKRKLILWQSNLVRNPSENDPIIEGEFSFAQWNLNATSSSSSNATSMIALDDFRLCDGEGLPVSSPEIELRPMVLRGR